MILVEFSWYALCTVTNETIISFLSYIYHINYEMTDILVIHFLVGDHII
jgi:hypothetical protein